jgi:uncharacterized protein
MLTLEMQLRNFAQHLRDPTQYPAPENIEERRLTVYRDLFFNNIESLLAGNFPVIKTILSQTQWRTLVRDFFRDHHSQTPLFPEIAREFIHYLEVRQSQENNDPFWLLELAHYEWVELALDIAESEPVSNPDDSIHSTHLLALSPLTWPLAYQWPVHRLSPDYLPEAVPETPTFLVVMRDSDYKIRFIEISALSFRLLESISEEDSNTGDYFLRTLAHEAQVEDIDNFMHHGQQMLQELLSCGALRYQA